MSTTFTNSDFERARGCGQLYFGKTRNITCGVHGDDFLSVANQKDSSWMDDFMGKSFDTKKKYVIGPGHDTVARYLHRYIIYRPGRGFEYMSDPKHVQLAAEALGLTKANAVPTPEVRDKPTRGDALDLLPRDQAAVYCSVTGRVIYLSVDRYDIMHAARSLCPGLGEADRVQHDAPEEGREVPDGDRDPGAAVPLPQSPGGHAVQRLRGQRLGRGQGHPELDL